MGLFCYCAQLDISYYLRSLRICTSIAFYHNCYEFHNICQNIIKYFAIFYTEAGLESAKRTTNILYGSQPEILADMTKDEIEAVFKSASSIKLLLEPGTSILDMALKAGCFLEESKLHYNAFVMQSNPL